MATATDHTGRLITKGDRLTEIATGDQVEVLFVEGASQIVVRKEYVADPDDYEFRVVSNPPQS